MSGPVEPKLESELLSEIDAELARRSPRTAFPDALERRFEADTGGRYARSVSAALRRGAIYYNLFIYGDYLLTPDTVWLAVGLHSLVVTPAMLLIAWLYPRRWRPLARDLAGGLVPFLIAAQILCVFAVSASPNVSHYLYFVALNTISYNSSLRLRYRAAKVFNGATFLALAGVLAATQKIPMQVSVMHCFSFVVCGMVTIRSVAEREREFRRAYLYGLRDRLRIAATDAEANHDPLTGALNRRGLDAAVRALWSGGDISAAVVLFDVDRFKAYNDVYGHPAGDACLRKIAAAARAALGGREARLARYGGEEFLVLLSGEAAAEAEGVADDIRRAVLSLNIVHAGAVERRVVSASFGVAQGRVGEVGFEALTAAADAALYKAKSSGRNKVTCALAA